MVLCKYFLDGLECPSFQKCPDEHLDIRQFIKTEMECAINGDQWPFSCFGPFTEKPSITNYIEDQSFEEVRMMYYESNCSRKYFETWQKFASALHDAKGRMRTLLAMEKEVMNVLIDLYDEPIKETTVQPKNPFDLFASNVFGGSGVFQFGSSSNDTPGGAPQKSVFGKNAFGFGFGVQQPRNVGVFSLPPPQQQAQFGGFFAYQKLQEANAFSGKSSVQTETKTPFAGRVCDDCKEYLKDNTS